MAKTRGRGRSAPSAPVRPFAAKAGRPRPKGPQGAPVVLAAPLPAPGLGSTPGLPGPTTGAPAGPPRLSPREAAALPSGARFVGLDGVARIRR